MDLSTKPTTQKSDTDSDLNLPGKTLKETNAVAYINALRTHIHTEILCNKGDQVVIELLIASGRLFYKDIFQAAGQFEEKPIDLRNLNLEANTYTLRIAAGDNQPCRFYFDLPSNPLS